MLFEGRYKKHDYFQYFLHLFSVPSFIFSKNVKGEGVYSCLPSKDSLNYSLKDDFTYSQSIKYNVLLVCLHVYRSIKTRIIDNIYVYIGFLIKT